jgi:hypothetical protein
MSELDYYYSRIRVDFRGGRGFYPVASTNAVDYVLRMEQRGVIVIGASAMCAVVDMGPGYTER